MTFPDFSKLKEYDSLSKRQQQLLREINEENARSEKIHSLISDHLARRNEIKKEIVHYNNLILELESQVKLLAEQKERLINQGTTEDKIAQYQIKINEFEAQAFSYLETMETLELELQETVNFESGARKTLSDIEAEVELSVRSKENEANNLRSHLEDILNELSPSLRTSLDKLFAKKLAHGPFTKIAQGACMMCRFKISKTDEAEIDVQKLLKYCPQCTRIFLPYGT